MCLHLSKQSIKISGLASVSIFCIFAFTSLVLAAISFEVMNTDWTEGPWKHLSIINIIVAIYCILCSFLGFILFSSCLETKIFIIIYIVLMLLSTIFSWSIGIFASIGGTIKGKVDDLVGCNSKLTGVLEMWKNVDDYYQLADSILCSSLCKCRMYTDVQSNFEKNPLTENTYKAWVIESFDGKTPVNKEEKKKYNFQSCSDEAKTVVLEEYISNQKNKKYYIHPRKFENYWKRIETRFECVGWCNLKYKSIFNLKEHEMLKYVFSDINQGIPKYPGCLYRLVNWIQSLIGAIGGCLVFVALIQTISVVLAFELLFQSLGEETDKLKNPDSGMSHSINTLPQEGAQLI